MPSSADEIFCEQYNRLKTIFCYIWITVIPLRVMIAIVHSYEAAFGKNQLFVIVLFSISVYGLIRVDRCPITVKKVYMFSHMQLCLFCTKFMSIKVEPQAEIIYAILSTILLLEYEIPINRSKLWSIFSMTKHIVIWFFIDFRYLESGIKLRSTNSPIYTVSIIAIFITSFFENLRFDLYATTVESKKACKAAHDQLYEILHVFPDGLLAISSENIVKFINNTMKEILENSTNPASYLGTIKCSNADLNILQQVKEFLNNDKSEEKSLGVFESNSSQYECRAHKIKWDSEETCMLTFKEITAMLSLERIKAESNAKNSIIRSISHEFRTPINCINLIIDEIYPILKKEIQEKVDIVKTNTKLLVFQLNDILDFSDLSLGKFRLFMSEVDIKKKVSLCADLIKCQAEYKGVKAFCEIDQDIPDLIATDGYRVQKVVVNLLTNALKYTSSGSIVISALNVDDCVKISVKDTGIGIPEDRQKHLFDMLSNNSNSSLSGLGLHVCKKILESLNSALSVESQLGQGTTFSFNLYKSKDLKSYQNSSSTSCFTLKATQEEPEIDCISTSNLKYLNSQSFEDYPKVMIVDDNEFNRMCLASILKNEGIKYIEANDGDVAVSQVILCDKKKEPIKCIIMDLNMPIMDGWEATRVINQLFSQGKLNFLPAVIAHTAYCSQEDLDRCYEAGMVSYIIKPTPKAQILDIIKKYA